MCANSLPKTVTRQRRGCDLNPGPSAPESGTLTTRLPSHRRISHSITETIATLRRVQTSPESGEKYSTRKAATTDAPLLGFCVHASRTLVGRTSLTAGLDGGPGYVDGSGVRRKMMSWLVGASTTSAADDVDSPVSLDALHVYRPVSDFRSSARTHARTRRPPTSTRSTQWRNDGVGRVGKGPRLQGPPSTTPTQPTTPRGGAKARVVYVIMPPPP